MVVLSKISLRGVLGCALIIGLFLIPNYAYSQSGCDLSANQCCQKSGQAALGACERAISCLSYEGLLPSNTSKVYMCQGITLGEMGRTEEALQALDKSIQYDPDNAKSHYNRGIVLEELGRDDEARRAYKKAVKLNPEMTLGWGNLAVSSYNIGHYRGAIKAFDTAVELDPSYFDSRPEQRELWDKAVKLRPWSVSLGREMSFRFTPNVGDFYAPDGGSDVNQFLYLLLDTEFDIQLYKKFFVTASFPYVRTTYKSPFSGSVDIFGATLGIKYCSMEYEHQPMGKGLAENARYWVSFAVGPYVTSGNLPTSIVGSVFPGSGTNVNIGANFAIGGEYYFHKHPNWGVGIQSKTHFVNFNNLSDSYFIFSFGPSIILRF